MTRSESGSTDLIDQLWNLVDEWHSLANDRVMELPFLSEHPRTALAQGLNKAADDLGTFLLNWVP